MSSLFIIGLKSLCSDSMRRLKLLTSKSNCELAHSKKHGLLHGWGTRTIFILKLQRIANERVIAPSEENRVTNQIVSSLYRPFLFERFVQSK